MLNNTEVLSDPIKIRLTLIMFDTGAKTWKSVSLAAVAWNQVANLSERAGRPLSNRRRHRSAERQIAMDGSLIV